MAATSYRVWFGCRINGTEYERGQVVTLDSADPGVIAALNYPSAPRIRPDTGGGGGGTPDTVGLLLGDCRAGSYGWLGRISFAAYYGSALSDARLLAHAQAAGLA